MPGGIGAVGKPDMTGYWRDYRLYITARAGDPNYTAMNELEFRIGGVDVSSPSSVTNHSTTAGAGFGSDKLVDNDFTGSNTRWSSDLNVPFPQWVSVSPTGSLVRVEEILIWPYGTSPTRAPMDFIVQGTLDGSTWVDICAYTGVLGWTADTPKTFSILNDLYKYFRVYITANMGAADYTSLAEIELLNIDTNSTDITTTTTPVTVSSFYDAYHTAASLVDNAAKTVASPNVWATATGAGNRAPCWFVVELPYRTKLYAIRMWSQFSLPARAPKDFVVQGSNNGTTWTNIKTFTNTPTWVDNTAKTFTLYS